MQTRILEILENKIEKEPLDEVCRILKAGGIVALPTETVYGLAADALNEQAVEKIFIAKGRPQDNPLIVHIADEKMLHKLTKHLPAQAMILARHFWPGPLTMVLPKSDIIPDRTSAGLDTVGIRMPSHPVIRAVIQKSGLPLAAPSANLSGKPSTTTAQHCIDDLFGRVDAIVKSGDCDVGLESTVISLAGKKPRLLRPGAITYEALCALLGEVELDDAVLGKMDPNSRVSAPGMKYRHYAPKARVQLILGPSSAFCHYVNEHSGAGVAALCFEEECAKLNCYYKTLGSVNQTENMAHALFAALRDLDKEGVQTVYAHCPNPTGMGMAVYNRLVRAAAFDVVRL